MQNRYHIGVDYHKRYSHLVVKDERGVIMRSGRVGNSKEEVAAFLQPFEQEPRRAVLEATRNWTVMYDWLEEVCDEVILANPLKVKAIAEAKIKTDKIDATILSDLLRVDLLPTAYVPRKEARALRLALRERMFFVRLRTMVKNRVYTVFDRYPEETQHLKLRTDLFGKEGRKQLVELALSDIDRLLVDRECEFIDDINRHMAAAEKTIEQYSKDNADVKRLITIPGIGKFFARLMAAEIDDIARFRSPKKLAAYVGLIPSTYASGGKTWNGRMIKGGNKWLRWAFIEAVAPAVRSDAELKEEYERLMAKKNYNKVKVAIAQKLLTITYHVLKEKRNYYAKNKLERERKRFQRLS
jgi:transposase